MNFNSEHAWCFITLLLRSYVPRSAYFNISFLLMSPDHLTELLNTISHVVQVRTNQDWNRQPEGKSLSGVNFINVLQTAFTSADPESAEFYNLAVFFSGSARVTVARKTLLKLTQGIDWKRQLESEIEPWNGQVDSYDERKIASRGTLEIVRSRGDQSFEERSQQLFGRRGRQVSTSSTY